MKDIDEARGSAARYRGRDGVTGFEGSGYREIWLVVPKVKFRDVRDSTWLRWLRVSKTRTTSASGYDNLLWRSRWSGIQFLSVFAG
jgi:hypothetical protein